MLREAWEFGEAEEWKFANLPTFQSSNLPAFLDNLAKMVKYHYDSKSGVCR
jgi:hypothetical protein